MSDNKPQKIVISKEDTQAERVVHVSQQMAEAEQYALVREVGNASTAPRGNLTAIAVLIMAGSGVVGGLLAFTGNRLFDAIFGTESLEAWISNLAFTFIMASAIGLSLVLIDAATQKNLSKLGMAAAIGFPVSIAAGLAVGAIAHFVYSPWVESVYESAQNAIFLGQITDEQQYIDYITSRLHLPRGVAWGIVGIAAGITIGTASRSLRRLLVTTAGGFFGGFVGGFVFDFFTGEGIAQFVGIVLTGLLIGLAMSLAEQAAKARWIEIVSGGMAGKQFILYKQEITIGSSPRADITLIKDAAIPEFAGRIVIQGNRATVESLNPAIPITINGQVVVRTNLVDGMPMTFGASVVMYRERSNQQKTPVGGPVRLS